MKNRGNIIPKANNTDLKFGFTEKERNSVNKTRNIKTSSLALNLKFRMFSTARPENSMSIMGKDGMPKKLKGLASNLSPPEISKFRNSGTTIMKNSKKVLLLKVDLINTLSLCFSVEYIPN